MAASSSNVFAYVEPTKTIVSKVKGYMETSTLIQKPVRIFWKTAWQDLVKYLTDIREFPTVVLVYTGSQFQNEPRRLPKLSAYLLYKNERDGETGSPLAQDIMDDLFKQVDHQIYNNALFLAAGDEPVDFPGAGLVAYRLDFIVQDH
jgi:hypothetical protein